MSSICLLRGVKERVFCHAPPSEFGPKVVNAVIRRDRSIAVTHHGKPFELQALRIRGHKNGGFAIYLLADGSLGNSRVTPQRQGGGLAHVRDAVLRAALRQDAV